MANDQIYTPEVIQENPYPNQDTVVEMVTTESSNKTTQQYGASKISVNPFPTSRIATELLSTKLNTKTRQILGSFTFTPSGALQIGNYQEGEHGDVRILPTGIIARNTLGDTTFALDGETGDATFLGTLQSGTILSNGVIQGGEIIGGVIQGGEIIGSNLTLGGENNGEGTMTAIRSNGDKYILIDNGALYFYGDASQTRAEVKFDPLENFLYTRILQVGGNYGGSPSQDGSIIVDNSLGQTLAIIDNDGVTTRNGRYLSIEGLNTPNAPTATNGVRLYLDTSGGKTRLMALFESGVAQVVATEP